MNSLKVSVRRAGSVFAALALVLTTALPGIASAAQVTERQITIGSAKAGETGVAYEIKFTAKADAGAVVVEFCSNSPLLGVECTAPSGFDIDTSSAVTGATFTKATSAANKLVVTGTIDVDAEDEVTIPVTGVVNPSSAGALYARIATFADDTAAQLYDDETPGAVIDDGGVALYIVPSIAVSAAVLESMTFCVSADDITTGNCATTTTPTLKLGEGDPITGAVALSSSTISQGTLYTQISTNALNGAVVRIKSDRTGCGGLTRDGAADFTSGCGIAAAGDAAFTAGQSKFGLQLGSAAAASGASTSGGTIRPYDGASGYYKTNAFKLNYVSGDATGVTGTYGDPLLDTDGAPVNNMNMPITFGASASNSTTAGNYRANLSLIATGTF